MELTILLSRDESSTIEHGASGEPDYDNLVTRLRRFATKIDSGNEPRVLGLDEDNELYELVLPTEG